MTENIILCDTVQLWQKFQQYSFYETA